jgi:hypothetical protein
MKPMTAMVVLCLSAAGCTGKDPSPRSTLNRQQKDSVLANSKLPGAKAVQGALDAVSADAARQQAADTIH